MPVSHQIICPRCTGIDRVPSERLTQSVQCGRCRTPLFSGKPVDVDASSFDRHIKQGDVPVLVKIWAPWCGSCRIMGPAFAAAACELEPQIRLIKLNSDSEPEMMAHLRIRTIPTMVLFSGGVEIARVSGGMVFSGIAAWAREKLANVQTESVSAPD